jgi:hypothetical protein
MKKRKGFVSNSSSSSFIVAFSKKPESVEEMQKLLFDDDQYFQSPYSDEKWSSSRIAEIVLNDMGTPATMQEMRRLVSYDYDYDEDIDDDILTGDALTLNRMVKDNPEKEFYIFRYSDNDGKMYTAMEHGNLFNNLPEIRISHH